MTNNETNKNLLLIKWISAARYALLVIPVMAIYYNSDKNVNMQNLFIIEAIYATIVVTMEIPSGWISDIWKRKNVLIIGLTILSVGAFTVWLSNNFWQLAVGISLMGVGNSLYSGTDTAIVYDSMLANKNEETFRKYEGERQSWALLSMAISAFSAGYIYDINIQLPAILSAVFIAIAAMLSLFIIEPSRIKQKAHKNPFKDMLETVKYAFHGHKQVASIILFSAVLLSVTLSTRWAEQAYIIGLKLPTEWFGIIAGFAMLSSAISGRYSYIIEDFLGVKKSIYLIYGITIIALLIASIKLSYLGIFMTILISGIFGYSVPLIKDGINKRVSSNRRATILSSMTLSHRFIFILLGPLTGYLIDNYGVQIALLTLAIFLFIGGIFTIKQLAKSNIIT